MAYVEFALEHPGLFRLMFGPLRRDLKRYPELNEAAEEAFDALLQGAAHFFGGQTSDAETAAYAVPEVVCEKGPV